MDEIEKLLSKGWTKRAICADPLILVARSTLDNWQNGRTKIPEGRRNVLKMMLSAPVPRRGIPGRKKGTLLGG